MTEQEVSFQCPYCFETISMLLDPSISHQNYIEDCEVCCRPIQISYTSSEDQIESVYPSRI